ncbi:glycosyltransferase [Vibrio sp. ZSDE26]|uniref:Glycosyltransferase n=1 Tax=Vibrio amylolyticus TaxID=2847292 RepID=A0A9X1XLI5_9VIBR|nr:glycosyltransferase [Vibrio amylolyticus]MCK6264946.1 glycosyltransferase [Vibrio amylolyticus]
MMSTKNVLFVHCGDDLIRGSEQCLLDLVSNIDRSRFNPFVLTNNPSFHEELLSLGIHSELETFSILLGWSSPRFNVKAWLRQVKQAKAYVKKANIDLIHVNSGVPCQWMYTVAKVTNTPMVAQLHSDYSVRDRVTLGLHYSPKIIAVSKAITHQLIKDGYPQDRLSIVHNGIDVKRLDNQKTVDVKKELNIDESTFTFATVGSLTHRKGVDRLLLALRHLVLEYPNVHLVIIGDGPQRDNLEQQVDYLKLSEHVHFVGEKRNVVGWLKGVDGFVSGARQAANGLVTAEAALASLPVIAPFEGGIPEILTHKKNAIFYKNSGTNPIVNAMRAVVKNRKSAKSVGRLAREHILEAHTAVHNVRAIENIYTQTISDNQQPTTSFWQAMSPIKTFLANHMA